MTDAVAVPVPAARPTGSFWWGLPIAFACLLLAHALAFAVAEVADDSGWAFAAFALPFVARAGVCLLGRRWSALAGAIVFPVVLVSLWILVLLATGSAGCD